MLFTKYETFLWELIVGRQLLSLLILDNIISVLMNETDSDQKKSKISTVFCLDIFK